MLKTARYNHFGFDRTLWYAIDYGRLEELVGELNPGAIPCLNSSGGETGRSYPPPLSFCWGICRIVCRRFCRSKTKPPNKSSKKAAFPCGFPGRKAWFSDITEDNREYPGISGPETPGNKYISEMFRLWRGLRLLCSIYNSGCCLLAVCLDFAAAKCPAKFDVIDYTKLS